MSKLNFIDKCYKCNHTKWIEIEQLRTTPWGQERFDYVKQVMESNKSSEEKLGLIAEIVGPSALSFGIKVGQIGIIPNA